MGFWSQGIFFKAVDVLLRFWVRGEQRETTGFAALVKFGAWSRKSKARKEFVSQEGNQSAEDQIGDDDLGVDRR